jgi:hypothetical protein
MVIILKSKKEFGSTILFEQAIALIQEIQAEHPNITAEAVAEQDIKIER